MRIEIIRSLINELPALEEHLVESESVLTGARREFVQIFTQSPEAVLFLRRRKRSREISARETKIRGGERFQDFGDKKSLARPTNVDSHGSN